MNFSGYRAVVCMISCVGVIQNTRVIHFLQALSAKGYHVIAIRPGELSDPRDAETIVHFPLPTPRNNFWYGAGFLNLLLAILQRLKNSVLLGRRLIQLKPDILICTEPDSWMLAILAKWAFGCKVIADIREVYYDRALAFPKFTQGFVRRLIICLLRLLSRHTDEIIHVSLERKQVYSFLHKQGIVIGSYPELGLFTLSSLEEFSEYVTPLTAIHVGALRSTYASEQLLEAMMIVAEAGSNMRFVVLGGVAGRLKNATLINSLKNNGVLKFVNQVPFSEVVHWLSSSDIGINLVLPVDTAHYLAAPQKLYEYFAAGLPVVVSDVPTLRRVITKYECGILVDASSPRLIADALIQISEDDETRKRMGKNARWAAEIEFNWESQASKLCLLVESLF